MKLSVMSCCFVAVVFVSVRSLRADEIVLSEVDRQIQKEPKYDSKPRYGLLIIGAETKVPVWIVQDGEQLYIDKNGNRDLTDDGRPVIVSGKRSLGGRQWDQGYVLDEWTLPGGSPVRDFQLRQWNYADPEDQYGLSLKVDGKVPMYAGWNALLTASPADAPVIHFGGPVAPRPLRNRELVLGTKPERFSIAFTTPRESKLAHARLSIDALPASVVPMVTIDWPVDQEEASLSTTHKLNERCCYWEFYTTSFDIPKRARVGTAKVTIVVPLDKFPLELCRDDFEMPVVRKE